MSKYKKYEKIPFEWSSELDPYPDKTPMLRCFESHSPLKIGEYELYGGSCATPIITDADVYIGFDLSMKREDYPWESDVKKHHVLYYIQDMGVPKDVNSFKKMIAWIADQLKLRKRIHLGCIGGHGRTGLVLSALVTYMTGNLNSITYVRETYCKKAVESEKQVQFLHDHFGVTKIQPIKKEHFWETSKVSQTTSTKERINAGVHKELYDIYPVKVIGNLWG